MTETGCRFCAGADVANAMAMPATAAALPHVLIMLPPHAKNGRAESWRGYLRSGCRIYDRAAFTRSGENGTRRMRTPVASKIALAIAAASGRIDGPPAPVGAAVGRSSNTTSI